MDQLSSRVNITKNDENIVVIVYTKMDSKNYVISIFFALIYTAWVLIPFTCGLSCLKAAIMGLILFSIVPFLSWNGVYWFVKGKSVLTVNKDGNFVFYRQSLIKTFVKKGKLLEGKGLSIYDMKKDEEDSAPRGDWGIHGGVIIVRYIPEKAWYRFFKTIYSLFRFGLHISEDEANLIINEVNTYLKE